MGVHSETIIMKAFIFATVLAVAAAIPLEDTEEVKAAKAEFMAAFETAKAGGHAALQAAQIPSAYLAVEPEVAEATAAHKAVFDAYTAGEIALPVAPVHEVAPVVATPAVAPVAVAAPYWGGYPYAGIPAYAHAGYAGYPYAGAYAGAYAHPYLGLHGYPYALPTVAVAPAKAE